MNKLCKQFFNNACKPKGKLGMCILKFMNGFGHKYLFEWAMEFMEIKDGDSILDIGCGGGGNISRLLKKYPKSKVCGVDYSPTAVALSIRQNSKEIENDRCGITEGNVKSLPYGSCAFDCVTAFETIYYWPDIENSFKEVFRVLKPKGRFIIVNGADAEGGWKWDNYIDGMHTYTPSELEKHLINTGFKIENINREKDLHIFCVMVCKENQV